jgi:DNA invertase Pin-like site-specific DNA recombinase
MGAAIAYCRVSSRDQNPSYSSTPWTPTGMTGCSPRPNPASAACSGPGFTAALSALHPGDTLVFWKSDRWGRSAAHVLTTIGELRDRGVRG